MFRAFGRPNVGLVSTPLTIKVTLCGITQRQRDSNCCCTREALSASLQQRRSLNKSYLFPQRIYGAYHPALRRQMKGEKKKKALICLFCHLRAAVILLCAFHLLLKVLSGIT